jgi:aconitate hydratase
MGFFANIVSLERPMAITQARQADTKHVEQFYASLEKKHAQAREKLGHPLTLAEKVLTSHMSDVCDEDGNSLKRGLSYANYFPDRVALQDATAQMALLQFMTADQPHVAVPTTVHCDHLIQAESGAGADLKKAMNENQEVYDFLKAVSLKYGLGFWQPGSGIIHQVVLENYAFPGGMMVGTDSHTPNAGGLGMVAIGVGGADAVDVMTGQPFSLRCPKVIGVRLTGRLQGLSSPKDIILKLMGILTVKGGTGAIVEFFGDGCEHISATGKGTICNMGAEHGATTSVFPYDPQMAAYLIASGRPDWAVMADAHRAALRADAEVYAQPEKYYDRVIEIDLSTLEPHIVGPHTPDLARPLSSMRDAVKKEGYPSHISAALIGSCTNSSYEDIGRAAKIAQKATQAGLKAKVPFYVTPGSASVYKTIRENGQLAKLEKLGAIVLANACGPCIGQWRRNDVKQGEVNSIVSSYNRNFPARNDGSAATLSFLASPEVVTAMAVTGTLNFDPNRDTVTTSSGEQISLTVPTVDALPKQGLSLDFSGFIAPSAEAAATTRIDIDPHSERLALLDPFSPWDGRDFVGLRVLLKAKEKCTTDHISPAGSWLRFRGHLDRIANNTYIGAINAFTGVAGKGTDPRITGTSEPIAFPELARRLKDAKVPWLVIGDENFGEGSSREHAAMQPRYLGCKAIITRSFARIHESNLKKHGVLPLTFENPDDWNKIEANDSIDIVGLANINPGVPIKAMVHHEDGRGETLSLKHTLSAEQIAWFKAGSALNYLAKQRIHNVS